MILLPILSIKSSFGSISPGNDFKIEPVFMDKKVVIISAEGNPCTTRTLSSTSRHR